MHCDSEQSQERSYSCKQKVSSDMKLAYTPRANLSHATRARSDSFLFPVKPRPSRRYSSCRALFGLFNTPSRVKVDIAEDEAGSRLRSWLQQQGMPGPQVVAAADPVYGRALVAAAPLRKGARTVQVPAGLVITAERAAGELSVSSLLEEQPLPAWSVLALWLVEARAAGSGHPWAPYIAVLPERTGCILEWTAEQVDSLRGSYLHQLATEICGAADASWQEMQPLIGTAERQGLARQGVFTQQALRWACSMLLTRLIRLPGLGDTEALVPWAGGKESLAADADLLNHDCGASTFLDWDAATEAVALATDRQYQPGEQVFMSYGQKTSGQLLLSYGFLPAASSNPHDACLLELTIAEDDPALAWKQEALSTYGLASRQVFPLRMGALPQGLLEFAALAAARPASLAEAQQLAARLYGSSSSSSSIVGTAGAGVPTGGSQEVHAAALQEVVRRCQAALKRYPASLEANKAELADVQKQQQQRQEVSDLHGETEWHSGELRLRQQVLQVVVQEQQVLSRAVFLLQQQLRQQRKG